MNNILYVATTGGQMTAISIMVLQTACANVLSCLYYFSMVMLVFVRVYAKSDNSYIFIGLPRRNFHKQTLVKNCICRLINWVVAITISSE